MKRYAVTAEEMKRYDRNTTQSYKLPPLLLMERAALATVGELMKCPCMKKYPCRVLIAAGCGNNGGDGLAIGRLLMLRGYEVDFWILGDAEQGSESMKQQWEILKAYGVTCYDRLPDAEYTIVVDAVFGVGLSRPLTGIYREAAESINQMNAFVCSADLPSGIHADTGQILGAAVRADLTVTYAFYKCGALLYPGAEYCGRLVCCDIGVDQRSFLGKLPRWHCCQGIRDVELPKRRRDGNKGTFGKVLVIAGSRNISGAALLSVRAAFRVGAGMVRVITEKENREILAVSIPEAMLTVYDGQQQQPDFVQEFEKALRWADSILIGPGIGQESMAKWLLEKCIKGSDLPLVVDADGLNLLAVEPALQEQLAGQHREVILTPHLAEFARLSGSTAEEVKRQLPEVPRKLAKRLSCVVVCKDARTVVCSADGREGMINMTGNSGMATAGTGDVLAGMIAGLLKQCGDAFGAAEAGVVLHGMAGDLAAEQITERTVMASDLIDRIPEVFAAAYCAEEEMEDEGNLSESMGRDRSRCCL